MGKIKWKCQVVGRRSWCQQVRCSPGSFSLRVQHPPNPNHALVMNITSPSWLLNQGAAEPSTLKTGLQKPWQRRAISAPGGTSGCPRCPPGTSSSFALQELMLQRWKSKWFRWGQCSSTDSTRRACGCSQRTFTSLSCFAWIELTGLFLRQKSLVMDEIYSSHILLPNNNNGWKN